MKIQKLLENYNLMDKEKRCQRIETKCKYLLKILQDDGFEELAYLEIDHMIVSQIMEFVQNYVNKYGTTSYISNFLKIFTPEFLAKIKDYNNHLAT